MPSYSFLSEALQNVQADWLPILEQESVRTSLQSIDKQLCKRHAEGRIIYPPRPTIFNALQFCSPQKTRIVILGQDPYHGEGEAMGLSFSVPPTKRIPPSLRNIYKELARDTGVTPPIHGDLTSWARQGVLLLNSVLTVEADRAGSHDKLGWQTVSNALISAVNEKNPGCVFMLWGNWARSNAAMIDTQRHLVLQAAHPSPLSANRGFFNCNHFSQANQWLTHHGEQPIKWVADQNR
jgi:uracil-DNA glycosylase